MVKLVKIRYIGGPHVGFENVMKEQLAEVLRRRGQIEILPEEPEKPKAKKEKPEAKE